MLAENASKFAGWKQYLDHLSPEARKAAGGLPRGVRDLGGRLQETWWDPSFPAGDRFEQGAVIGMSRPVKAIRELIDDDPALVEASISASATGVRPIMHDGSRAWLVEGIHDRGSLDWVTEAGAGGRIAPLLESAYASAADVELALVESMDDGEYQEYLREHGRAAAGPNAHTPEGGDDVELTPEVVQEALKKALADSPTILTEAMQSDAVQEHVSSLVEAQIAEERDLIEARAQARVDRAFQLAGLEREAHRLIAESKLPDSWQEGLRKRYALAENRPTSDLDVHDDFDDDGNVVKPAADKLREALDADIEAERSKLREASPTRVRGAGTRVEESAPGEGGEGEPKGPPAERPYWATVLNEAGFEKPEEIYARGA